jgi:DNA-binding MarR family transcriptional regulator
MQNRFYDHVPLVSLMEDLCEGAIDELHRRLAEEGYDDVRPGHDCVFRFITTEGARLTELAERSGLTKQAVGEVVADLERRGYLERVPDPKDGRAKIIRLTDRGVEGTLTAARIFDEIEERWEERVGAEELARVRDTLERLAGAPTPEPLRG